MPSNSTGRWVERAATTGGGRTYRGQMPVNWYATLVLICVVGLLLIGFSRYQRTHQASSSTGPPTTQQQWFAALGVDICGKMQPDLPASTNTTKTGLVANGNGVLTVAPKNSSESGGNATLGKFVSGYHGLELNSSTLQYPGQPAVTNGDVCPKGTPQAGKPGVVIVVSWPSFTSKGKGTETSGPPQDLKFANGQLITMAFVPATVAVPKPPAKAITNLITAVTSGTASTTTTLPTTVPSTTPSTAPPTTAPTPATTPTATTQKPAGNSK
ncbi:MAG TPA: hypothetical protein VG032_11870 [Acidimicrobiales bacterium]|jgi:hypothetical protein|nr:hypothetical protein [Acidimicrobiales bacterium]